MGKSKKKTMGTKESVSSAMKNSALVVQFGPAVTPKVQKVKPCHVHLGFLIPRKNMNSN